ncbi:MAG: iron-sulfur cluster assembly protein [Alphaproteobacteria bacterium]|nr:iron-sulfur cluster assembly protein [Alphaproteobacteria bacterium]
MKMQAVADQDMLKNALGEEGYDELAEPGNVEAPNTHSLWPKIKAAIKEVYDPEIPVNVYELGLIYKVEIKDRPDGQADVDVKMTLTSPGCPVAQEMPSWVQGAVLPLEGVNDVDVEIVWEPTWNPGMMAETAKMQLNMFS